MKGGAPSGGSTRPDDLAAMRDEIDALKQRIAELEEAHSSAPALPLPMLAGLLQLPILFFRLDSAGVFTHIFGRGFERLSTDQDGFLGRTAFEAFPEAQENIEQSLGGDTVWNETSGVFEGKAWTSLTYMAPDQDGGAIGVALDVTEWKLARIELEASERRFRSLADVVPVAITRTSLDGRVGYANPRMTELTGISPDALLGRSWSDLVLPEDRERIASLWSASLAAGTEHRFSFRLIRDSGDPIWVLCRSVVDEDSAGQPSGYTAVLTDISERKRIEQELNLRVAERTTQLVEANKELEAFSYSVSHDLRTPLRGIDGFSLMLLQEYGDRLDADGRAYLDRVRSAAQRMGRLIDDLLGMSRASLGEISKEIVDLSLLGRAIAEELTAGAPTRAVAFEIEEGLVAEGDSRLLRTVLENLLGNAFKFTGQRELGRIRLGKTGDDEDTTFYVRDNGAGFDPTEAGKLFQTFQRLHQEEQFPGTGIGLATVDRIVRRHGGRVWFQSAPDNGATFYFQLARTSAPGDPGEPARSTEPAPH